MKTNSILFIKNNDPQYIDFLVSTFGFIDQTHLIEKCFGDTKHLNIDDLGINSWYLVPSSLSNELERMGEYILYDDQSPCCWWGVSENDK